MSLALIGDFPVFLGDAGFTTRFLDYRSGGHRIRLLGGGDLRGNYSRNTSANVTSQPPVTEARWKLLGLHEGLTLDSP